MARRTESIQRVGRDAQEFGLALAQLTKYFNMPKDYMDVNRVKVYEHGLADVPGPLVMAAAMRATQERTWFPKVNELRADAEACRRELLADHPFVACSSCNGTGWTAVLINSVDRYIRCMCWKAWREKLSSLGVTPQALTAPDRRQLAEVNE